MRRRFPVALAALISFALAWAASPLRAGICSLDEVPAATLLLPYFEVDLVDSNGPNTLISVNNAASAGVVAHVVLWTDMSVPTLDFDVYLTGYDSETIDLRDIFINRKFPRTAPAGQDPNDTISPRGPFSQDPELASCAGLLPPPNLPTSFATHIRAAHTGNFSAILNGCAGLNHGDDIARGYVTIDAMNRCSLKFPGDLGYFQNGGTGDASNQNVLWGSYAFVDFGGVIFQNDTLVHIEASTSAETAAVGQHTFYGRYVNWTAADNREPLGTRFAAPFVTVPGSSNTDLIVWRDPKLRQNAFKCGTVPSWYPLFQDRVLSFDSSEEIEDLPGTEFPFPAAAQRTRVDGFDFPLSFPSGWTFLDLNTAVISAGLNPPEDPSAAQGWVKTVRNQNGLFAGGFDAIHLDSACQAKHKQPGPP